jgi:mannose-6-phosphate isomerase-like protein (cupin superfamily)
MTLVFHLLAVIQTRLVQALAYQPHLAPVLHTVIDHLRRVPIEIQPLMARRLPVCRYLPDLLHQQSEEPVSRALTILLPHLAWVQNPNYMQGKMPMTFLENYGYADIISRRGLIFDHAFALGFLVLGPHTEYPPHNHPAAELYYTVSGTARWWQTGQKWTQRKTDTFVYHPSSVAHAMCTDGQPVCLLYAWWGEVGTAARLIERS